MINPYNSEQERYEERIANICPPKTTQCEDLLAYLQRWDHGITSFEAYDQLGITQLTARLSELKKKGHQFDAEWQHRTARNGRQIQVKRYRLA